MEELSEKKKALIWIFLITPFTLALFLFGLPRFLNLFSGSDVLVFSEMLLVTILSPLIFLPITIVFIIQLVGKKDVNVQHRTRADKILIFLFPLIIIINIVFSFAYKEHLTSNGYFYCLERSKVRGISVYVNDEALCKKKKIPPELLDIK